MGNPRNRAQKSSRKNKNTRLKDEPLKKHRTMVNDLSINDSFVTMSRPEHAVSRTENQLTPRSRSSSAKKIGDLSGTLENSQHETEELADGFVLFDYCI